jgi:hypothetical protein
MRRLSDLFIEAAASCMEVGELAGLLGDAASELGFHFFALVDHSILSGSSSALRIDNYPGEWVEELIGRGYAPDDPVHLASRRTNAGLDDTITFGTALKGSLNLGWKMLGEHEGELLQFYQPDKARKGVAPNTPDPNSGITVSTDFDIGRHTPDELRAAGEVTPLSGLDARPNHRRIGRTQSAGLAH